ncbi:MAG: DJ/PfpI family protein [Ilumatobacteraceae bacterium]|nr:DJ/PfpI family protein [Ilumatobacteraceae bacterium]
MQRLGVLQADASGDGGDGEIGGLQETADRLDPELLDVHGGGGARLGPEGAGERAGAHAGPLGEAVDGEILVEVVREPALDLDDGRGAGGLGLELGAELGLAAGSPGEHHQPCRHLVGHLGPVVGFDERQCQVDPGGDAGGGPAVAVVDVDLVGEHLDRRAGLGQQVARRPVGGGLEAVEQARRTQHQRAGADRRDAPGPSGQVPDLREEGVVGHQRPGAPAADHEQGVEVVPQSVERGIGADLDSAGGLHPSAAGRGDDRAVRTAPDHAVGGIEHLERPREVQQLELVEGDQDDGAGLAHEVSVRHARSGRNDKILTIPATG